MGVVISLAEQRRVADAARRVGGYDQLVRLAKEKRAAQPGAKLVRNAATGQWTYKSPKD